MNNIQKLDDYEVIFIPLVVATFLLATGRALQAIELCKEGLALLNKITPYFGKQKIYGRFYYRMFEAYRFIHDNTNAIEYGSKLLDIYHECGETVKEGNLSMELAHLYWSQDKYMAKVSEELYERATNVMKDTGNKRRSVLLFPGEYHAVKDKEILEEALAGITEIGDRKEQARCYRGLGARFRSIGDNVKAKECYAKALAIAKEIGDRKGEAKNYKNLGTVFQLFLSEHVKAKECFEKALAITAEIGDRKEEAEIFGWLGIAYQYLDEWVKAKECHEKALTIATEIGDRNVEAAIYECLGTVFKSLGEYVKAKEIHEKALVIAVETGDREREAGIYRKLGTLFQSLGEYVKAKENLEKAIAIATEIGDRKGEAENYQSLGTVFQFLSEYVKAKECHEKALAIATEIRDRKGEALCYRNLGIVIESLGEYVKTKEYFEEALNINSEIGDRKEEANNYVRLGAVLQCLGEYVKAEKYLEKALAIQREIGDRELEVECYQKLGSLFFNLDEDVKAKEYLEKALAIAVQIGNREMEATCYGELGKVFVSLRKYRESKQYFDKALRIVIKIGDRNREAICYVDLGTLFESLGDNVQAKRCYKRALDTGIKIRSARTEAVIYLKLGHVCQYLDEYDNSEEYLEKALSISRDIKEGQVELNCYCSLAFTKLSQRKFEEAFLNLSRCTEKCEVLRALNADNDQIKLSLGDVHVRPYQLLSEFLCYAGDPKSALFAVELGRARGLADLMATQYSAKTPISADPQSWIGIGNAVKKESNCTCLYISYNDQQVFLWILKTNGGIHFRRITVDKNTLYNRLDKVTANLDEFFSIMADSFRSFGILPEELCEDRPLHDIEPKPDPSQEENRTTLRQRNDKPKDPKPSLSLFYEMLIDPVSEFLKEPEIIIVPDRRLYRVPFPALIDKNGKYLSQSFNIRIVPSLTTLKIVQDSPADYHSQTGALIVGDPVVGEVFYDGSLNRNFVPIPGARKEAETLGQLLGVDPLLGKHATKQTVLQRIRSVSLIHLAAHGNPERGEIALAPLASVTGIPQEKDYLLKMSDISQIQVRAKLVVLSCCHSARGQIRAEGVVGIARAFLGSGARSVLVSLWAVEDSVTEQLMTRFYEHLIRGESASECLHEAMKWMRDNGFSEVRQWAPFMLIGDNVTFDFGNKVLQEDKISSMEEARETDGEK